MQALCRAFGKLVTRFNDLGSRIDDIAADNLGAGMRIATKPVPIVANPARPKLKMLASTTVAAV